MTHFATVAIAEHVQRIQFPQIVKPFDSIKCVVCVSRRSIICSFVHAQTFGKIYFIAMHRINREPVIDRLWTRQLQRRYCKSHSKTTARN